MPRLRERTDPHTLDAAPAPNFSFTGHETFVFRYAWLPKAADAVAEDPAVFSRDNAIVRLGVGKNMVRSIKHWALATGVLADEPKTRGAVFAVSELGEFLLGRSGRDPYLEDPGTLWLLHWQLLSHPTKCTTWRWAFSVMPSGEFTRNALVDGLMQAARASGAPEPSESSVRRDVEVFVRTYLPSRTSVGSVPEESLDCPLVELELLQESSGVFRFVRGRKDSLPDAVFSFAIAEYWQRLAAHRESLSFTDVLYGVGSPGSAFKLDENSLIERLERLESFTDGDLSFADTAGVKQLYRRKMRPALQYLQKYFRRHTIPQMVGV